MPQASRHFAEWRLFFLCVSLTIIDTVNGPIWKVIFIRIPGQAHRDAQRRLLDPGGFLVFRDVGDKVLHQGGLVAACRLRKGVHQSGDLVRRWADRSMPSASAYLTTIAVILLGVRAGSVDGFPDTGKGGLKLHGCFDGFDIPRKVIRAQRQRYDQVAQGISQWGSPPIDATNGLINMVL